MAAGPSLCEARLLIDTTLYTAFVYEALQSRRERAMADTAALAGCARREGGASRRP
jgi:hypothetical protein